MDAWLIRYYKHKLSIPMVSTAAVELIRIMLFMLEIPCPYHKMIWLHGVYWKMMKILNNMDIRYALDFAKLVELAN